MKVEVEVQDLAALERAAAEGATTKTLLAVLVHDLQREHGWNEPRLVSKDLIDNIAQANVAVKIQDLGHAFSLSIDDGSDERPALYNVPDSGRVES